jgi:hypothetical protein
MTLDLHSLFSYVFGSSLTLELNTELVGNFDSEEEAGIARDFAIKDFFSEYSSYNFPHIKWFQSNHRFFKKRKEFRQD